MKDLYSFSRSEEEFRKFYKKCAEAYLKIFKRVGIGDFTYQTVAGGGSFTAGFTDEFQVLTEAGEDIIYVDRKKKIAINKEVYSEETLKQFNLSGNNLEEKKAVEVGNIFPLGTKYSEALGLKYRDQNGKEQPVIMGSYGIGLGRLLGTIAEVSSDRQGLIWPARVAPFQIHLVRLDNEKETTKSADSLYKNFLAGKVEVLYDDRDQSPGEKFADADMLGIPVRVIVSKKNASLKKLEVKERKTGHVKSLSFEDLLKIIG